MDLSWRKIKRTSVYARCPSSMKSCIWFLALWFLAGCQSLANAFPSHTLDALHEKSRETYFTPSIPEQSRQKRTPEDVKENVKGGADMADAKAKETNENGMDIINGKTNLKEVMVEGVEKAKATDGLVEDVGIQAMKDNISGKGKRSTGEDGLDTVGLKQIRIKREPTKIKKGKGCGCRKGKK